MVLYGFVRLGTDDFCVDSVHVSNFILQAFGSFIILIQFEHCEQTQTNRSMGTPILKLQVSKRNCILTSTSQSVVDDISNLRSRHGKQ